MTTSPMPYSAGDPAPEIPHLLAWQVRAWQAAHPYDPGDRDHVRIDLRAPRTAPSAHLDVVNHGTFHEPRERLPFDGRYEQASAHLNLGALQISGNLTDLVGYVNAMADALQLVTWQACQLAAAAREDQERNAARLTGQDTAP